MASALGTGTNFQTQAYTAGRAVKEHERIMLALIAEADPGLAGSVIDLGCADGKFVKLLKAEFPQADCTGVDLDPALIARAREEDGGVAFRCGDVRDIARFGRHRAIVASGILSVFDDPEPVLANWVDALEPGGRLFVFGRFNTADIDVRIAFRVGERAAPWEGGWTAFSLKTIREVAEELGCRATFRPFVFSGRLERTDDPVKTFTIEGVDGTKYTACGGNVLAEQYFAVLEKI
jgi:trans-aconitate methyltransferase